MNAAHKSKPDASHLLALDVVRGIAILGVMVHHALGPMFQCGALAWSGPFPDFEQSPSLAYSIVYVLRVGNTGVPLFFLLSGYCIQLSTQRRNGLHAGDFLTRRFFRIYPPYLIALVAFSAVLGTDRFQFFTHTLFVHNLHDDAIFGGVNPSFWSLPVEFQLYMIFPLFHLAANRVGWTRSMLGVALVTAIFFHVIPATAADWLAPLKLGGSPFAFACLFLVLLTAKYLRPVMLVKWWLCVAAYIPLMEWLIFNPRLSEMRWTRAVAWIGSISYSLYLWHQPIYDHGCALLLDHIGLQRTPLSCLFLRIVPATGGVILLSWLTHRWLEIPSQNLGRKICHRFFHPNAPAPVG